MNLFDAPATALKVHACNCKGVWGSGIAKEFKLRYPDSFLWYEKICKEERENLLGTAIILPNNIGCLFTSVGFGETKSKESIILLSTFNAIVSLLKQAKVLAYREIHSNEFNSGLFKIPWHKSEKILKEISETCEDYPEINWTICEWMV